MMNKDKFFLPAITGIAILTMINIVLLVPQTVEADNPNVMYVNSETGPVKIVCTEPINPETGRSNKALQVVSSEDNTKVFTISCNGSFRSGDITQKNTGNWYTAGSMVMIDPETQKQHHLMQCPDSLKKLIKKEYGRDSMHYVCWKHPDGEISITLMETIRDGRLKP